MALDTLKSAPDHGFPARRFHTKRIERRLASPAASDRAEGERQLRSAVLDYARAQHGLTIPAAALPPAWSHRPSTYDAEAELNAALRGGRLRAWLDALPPQTPVYQALQAAYVAAKEGPAEAGRLQGRGRPVETGEQDARRLCASGGSQEGAGVAAGRRAAPGDAPADERMAGLRVFQAWHGLRRRGSREADRAAACEHPGHGRAAKLRATGPVSPASAAGARAAST